MVSFICPLLLNPQEQNAIKDDAQVKKGLISFLMVRKKFINMFLNKIFI